MTLSTIVHAGIEAARDFASHTSSTPPRSYFAGPIHIDGSDEDPWAEASPLELERARRRLAVDQAERLERAALRARQGAELRRTARFAGAVA